MSNDESESNDEKQQEIFLTAASMADADEQTRFLEEACGEDDDMRAKIQWLLESDKPTLEMSRSEVPSLAKPTPDRSLRAEASSLRPKKKAASNLKTASALSWTLDLQVGDLIARGGMGAVLEATDAALDRTVALKLILPEADESSTARSRFLREAGVLARLEHPNIVPIYDLGLDEDDRPFYTMKLVKGRTLQAVLTDIGRGKAETIEEFPLARLLTIFRQICDAIAFAHSRGVIHRDLKPENIMVGEFGETLVMDWGLAKLLDEETGLVREATGLVREATGLVREETGLVRELDFAGLLSQQEENEALGLTLDGTVIGSPNYMSPEQAEGRVAEVDECSDIYSLGGLLYAILTLRPPVRGSTLIDTLQRVIGGSITEPAQLTSDGSGEIDQAEAGLDLQEPVSLAHLRDGLVPAALSSVAMKALSLSPADRYESVAELAEDIDAYQTGYATSLEEVGVLGRLVKWIGRNRGLAYSIATALVVLVVVSGIFTVQLVQREREARQEATRAVKAEGETRFALSRASLALADQALRDADVDELRSRLSEVPEDLRDNEWAYLQTQANQAILEIDPDEPILAVAPIPTRAHCFVIYQNGQVSVLNVKTGEKELSFTPAFEDFSQEDVCLLAVLPEMYYVAVGRRTKNDFVVHNLKHGKMVAHRFAPKTEFLEFGKDGRLLQGDQEHATVTCWDIPHSKIIWKDESALHAVFTQDRKSVLKFSRNQGLHFADEGNQVTKKLVGRGAGYKWKMAISPDNLSAVTYSENSGFECVNLEDGSVRFKMDHESRGLVRARGRVLLGFSTDSNLTIIGYRKASGRLTLSLWNTLTGELVREIPCGFGQPDDLKVHPLSGEILITGSGPCAWDIRGSGKLDPTVFKTSVAESLGFLGGSDLVLGTPVKRGWGLYQKTGAQWNQRWIHEKPEFGVVATVLSQDTFALVKPGSNKSSIEIFRAGPDNVVREHHYPVPFWIYNLRSNPSGGLLACFERPFHPAINILEISTGKWRPDLDLTDVKSFWDFQWTDESVGIGLVTTKADRSEPGSEEWICRWNVTDGSILNRAKSATPMDTLAVHPDRKIFAEAGSGYDVRIRDSVSLEIQETFRAHNESITALAWHPSGKILATASEDLTVKLWDMKTGTVVAQLNSLVGSVNEITFSPDGSRIALSAIGIKKGRLWDWEEADEEGKN